MHPADGSLAATACHGPARGRPRRTIPGVGRLALLALLALVLTGCTAWGGVTLPGDGEDTGGGTGDDPAATRAAAAPIWREFAGCVRTHGYPEFPDPVLHDDGTAEFQGDSAQLAKERHPEALQACQPILRRLPTDALRAASARKLGPPPTPAQVDQLRRFAQCVRDHGIPEWPDPGPDGAFQLSDDLAEEGKSPRYRAAMQACKDLNPDPDGRVRVSGRGSAPKQ